MKERRHMELRRERDAVLKRLAFLDQQIAALDTILYGRPRERASWAANRLRDDRIVELWPTHSTRAIAADIGLSGQRVAQIVQRLYAEGRVQPRPPWWRALLLSSGQSPEPQTQR